MAKIVDTNRFFFGIILIIASIVIAFVSQFFYILVLVIAGIAFMIDGVTARMCPNGHIVYRWSRLYQSPVYYCPTCGAPLDRDDEESSDEYYQRASGPRGETS